MDSVASANVDTSKFFSLDSLVASKAISIKTEWKCSDFALKMLEEGVHADITFNAVGGYVKAHKSVLACVSPVFNAMFQHDMKEQLTSIVDVLDMAIDALQLFLLMLYTAKEADNESALTSARQMPHFTAAIDKHFGEIYNAVLKYQVEIRLGSVVILALARILTPENCWFYYGSLLMTALGPFTDKAFLVCMGYVLGNYHDVIKSSSFVKEMRCNPWRLISVLMKAESRDARKEALKRFLQIKRL